MSALWLEFILMLCFYGTAWTDADVEGVVRRNVGQSVTIQCKSTSNQDTLNLKKGLNEEQDIFYATINSNKYTIDSKFTHRLQYHPKFPNVDILIKNLTLNDTGPYWCVYKMMDENYVQIITKGSGSVLLVVTENKPSTDAVRDCKQSQSDMVLWAVVITAAVLIVILSIFLILMILKKKPSHNTVKRRQQVPTNDVYEDMRGTIRR